MSKSKHFNAKDLSTFCYQMHLYTKSGVNYETGLRSLISNDNNSKTNPMIEQVILNLRNNNTLTDSLEKTGVFPKYLISVLKVAQDTGSLEESFKSLEEYYSREAEINEMVKTAILYPFILIIMLLTVFLFLAIEVLPIFEAALKNLGSEFTGLSLVILNMGRYISANYIVFWIILAALLFIILYFTCTKKGKKKFMHVIWQSKTFKELAKATLSDSLSTCIESGLSIDYALEISKETIFNDEIARKSQKCLDVIRDTDDFKTALIDSQLFEGINIDIVIAGINTGAPDESLNFISSIFNDNFENKLQRTISLIEPISIAIISILIGAVLVSVMLPLVNIISTIGA